MISVKRNQSISQIIRRLAFWVFVGGIFFITAAALLADFSKVKNLLLSITPGWLIAIIGAVLFNYLLRFAKWCYFLHLIKVKIPFKENLWVFFSAFTMVLSPGKLGELVKSLLIKSRRDIPVSRTGPIVFAERLTDLIGLLILCAVGFSKFKFGGQTLVVLGIALVAGIFLMTRKSFWGWLDSFLSGKEKLKKFRDTVKVIEESTQNLLSLKSILITAPLSALSWAGEGFALYFIFCAMGVEAEKLVFISIFAHSFSSIVGALSFLPGGLLVTEGAMGAFFVYVAIPKAEAVSATFLIRAVTLWFAVILGTIVFLIGHKKSDIQALSGVTQENNEAVNNDQI
jgi:uncharacterized protein (TIRG00374 family)